MIRVFAAKLMAGIFYRNIPCAGIIRLRSKYVTVFLNNRFSVFRSKKLICQRGESKLQFLSLYCLCGISVAPIACFLACPVVIPLVKGTQHNIRNKLGAFLRDRACIKDNIAVVIVPDALKQIRRTFVRRAGYYCVF